MLKPLALTLMAATFLASGATFVPAADTLTLSRTETFTTENLTVIPVVEDELIVTEKGKTDREDKPKS